MFLLRLALRQRTFMGVLTVALALAGVMSFFGLGRLEDPDFTIKTAVVMTHYPGASAQEVENEVTERLETAIQALGEVDNVISYSRPEQSVITVNLKDTTPQDTIPQVWDELRRKVGDARPRLPPGVYPPSVIDDYGDVYGTFFAIKGDGYSRTELDAVAEALETELLTVEGVASVATWGAPQETIDVTMTRAQLAEFGLTPAAIYEALSSQSQVVSAGQVHADGRDLRLRLRGGIEDLADIENLVVRGAGSERRARLGDLAELTVGVSDAPTSMMFFDGEPAIGLGISTVSGGNVVDTGRRVMARLDTLRERLPVGVTLEPVSFQAQAVDDAVNAFLINLAEAVAIVVGVLLLFMGARSGLLIGGVLILTILGTFVFMDVLDIALQRISLGALIIALGMLVDNAIVVVEGMLVRIQRGEDREEAARASVAESMWPLLGATAVAILAFGAISLSPNSAGEFLSSLFSVVGISLLLSWVLAITVTPLLGVLLLRAPKGGAEAADPYGGRFFSIYRRLLATLIRFRWVTIMGVGCMLVVATVGFGSVKQNFFPDSSRPQFMVDYWRPEGSHIADTAQDLHALSEHIRSLEGVSHTASFAGSGALRFILTYQGELPNPSYGQILVTVDDHEDIDRLRQEIRAWTSEHMPDAEPRTKRFVIGVGGAAKLEVRFSGPDATVLRDLAAQAEQIMRDEPLADDVRHDWRSSIPVLHASMLGGSAERAGVTRADIAQSLAMSTSGMTIGTYRRGEDLLPIRLKLPDDTRNSIDAIDSAPVWSSLSGAAMPVGQVISAPQLEFEEGLIRRRNRVRTITVQAEPSVGVASIAFAALQPKIEAMELPPGYTMEWGGEHESSGDARSMLLGKVPLFLGLMFIIVVGLFNSLRIPAIVFATLPLSIIGVTAGLLAFDQAFGFVALLGFLSLAGMLIKNAIVLIEQINLNLEAGMEPFDAVVDAGVTRVRPVTMAAFTTVLGMLPLISDVFFGALAVTIVGGLTFATVLTLLVVPVLYATLYRVRNPRR